MGGPMGSPHLVLALTQTLFLLWGPLGSLSVQNWIMDLDFYRGEPLGPI